MSNLNDDNARAVARSAQDRVTSFLSHFSRGGTWEEWSVGSSEAYLEQFKSDLVMIASVVEHRLQDLYAGEPTDFGT